MLKTILKIAIILLILIALYWFIFLRSINMTTVKTLVAKASANYSDPANVQKLLLQGVREIEASPTALKQAKAYAKISNIPLEQVIVDNAVAMAKQYGYIA